MTATLDKPVYGGSQGAAPGAPPRERPVAQDVLTWVLAAVSLLAVWVIFFAVGLSGFEEAHAQRVGYAKLREDLGRQVAPLGGALTPDSPVALMTSSALGMKDLVVFEGTASGDLRLGPGHRRDTVLPGQPGVAVVYGRDKLFGGPFGDLHRARKGDTITVTTGQGKHTYTVEGTRRAGDPFPAALASGAGRLTLVTADGGTVSNLWKPKQVLYVDATLSGSAQPSHGVGASAVPLAERALEGDPGSLFRLVLWLPLLVLAGLAVTWAVSRWGRWQAWLLGMPLVLAALWGATRTAVELLPNLM